MKSKRRLRYLSFNLYQSLILLLFLSAALTGLAFVLQPNNIHDVIDCIYQNPIILFNNFLPIFIMALLVFFIFSSLSLSIVITSWVAILLSVTNRYKILIRQEPFLPADIGLYREGMAIISKELDMQRVLAVLFIFLILSIFIVLILRTIKLKWFLRISGVLICLTGILILNQTVYSNKKLYSNLYIKGTNCFQVNHYNSKGFNYCFWYFMNSNRIEKPEGYCLNNVKTYFEDETCQTSSIPAPAIHTILIMGEAFSDICQHKDLSFEEFSYPLENFEKLKKEGLSGYIITPTFGGGTANTEFDVLTGLCTQFINENASSFWYIRKPTDSLAHHFKRNGYKTIAIHPGYAWFYNRQNVYKHLGFDTFICNEQFDQSVLKGQYITEKATIDKVLTVFSNHQLHSHDPIFIHCVTIQNHYPYSNKYGAVQNFSSEIKLNEIEVNYLSNYFEGLKDADIELKRLTDTLNENPEPVIVLYFGDHLPSFGGGLELYQKIGCPMAMDSTIEERLNMHKVPFVLWQNQACKGILGNQSQNEDIKETKDYIMSANYLGGLLLEIMRFHTIPPIFSYSNHMYRDLPVITRHHYKTSSGYTKTLSHDLEEILLQYKRMQYYILTE